MIFDLIAAANSSEPFALAWKRARHLRNGHPSEKSFAIDKIRSEKYPGNDAHFVYTVNIRKCMDCGLFYLDSGMEYRDKRGAK